jgi:polyisoprenoid-binding protein YceI
MSADATAMVTHVARTATYVARAWVPVVLVTVLSACVPRPVETPAGAVTAAPAAGIAHPAGTRAFDVDPGRSAVTILVYRSGPLARLGHNHAITAHGETGVVWLGAAPAASGFEIRVPVDGLVVDDPQARAAAGPEFPGAVPDDARAGTTTNMLRPEVLDAARYPEIVVRSLSSSGTWQQAVAHASIRLKDRERAIEVPVALAVTADAVTATGGFKLRQTDFGITPFSVAGGAIQVADVVDVRFVITAVARR